MSCAVGWQHAPGVACPCKSYGRREGGVLLKMTAMPEIQVLRGGWRLDVDARICVLCCLAHNLLIGGLLDCIISLWQQMEENMDTNGPVYGQQVNAEEGLHDHIESVILVALRMRNHAVGHVVDIAQLQEDCQSIGYSSREFSAGFVRLLMKRYLQPYGEFSFSLSEHGFKAGEKALLNRIRRNGSQEEAVQP